MLKTFLEAGGSNNENYCFPLRVLKARLEEALLAIPFMSKSDADHLMATRDLTYRHVCTVAETEYRKQYDRKEWPPARHAKDAKGPPRNFGANNITVETDDSMKMMTKAEFLNLIDNMGRENKKDKGTKGNCHLCGSKDHWARNCPKNPRNKTKTGNKDATPAKGKGKGRRVAWKYREPKNGESEKTTRNGIEYQWCKHCGRWTPSHNTLTHKGNRKMKRKRLRSQPHRKPTCFKAWMNFGLLNSLSNPHDNKIQLPCLASSF
jgi:hypothetical protein